MANGILHHAQDSQRTLKQTQTNDESNPMKIPSIKSHREIRNLCKTFLTIMAFFPRLSRVVNLND